MGFDTLLGNEQLKQNLTAARDRDRFSHFYLICGPEGSGRHTLADLLAAAMLCTGADAPCGVCPSCRKVLSHSHPDYVTVDDPEKATVPVELIRQARADVFVRPNEGRRKIYLFPRAQDMGIPGQNALLKVLEEPPEYGAFLLLTDNPNKLLPTVRSRCEVLALSPVTVQEAESFLAARYPDRTPAEIAHAAARCEGILGRAVDQLEGKAGDGKALEGAATLLKRLCDRDELAILDFCAGLERDKWDRDAIGALLDEFLLLTRDCLVCAAGALHESDPRRRALAEQGAEALSPKVLTGAAALAEQLRTACGFYVGAGHIAGWLGAGLARIFLSQE